MEKTKEQLLSLFNEFNRLDRTLLDINSNDVGTITNYFLKHEDEYKQKAHLYDEILSALDEQIDLITFDFDLSDLAKDFLNKAIKQNEMLIENAEQIVSEENTFDIRLLTTKLNENLARLKSYLNQFVTIQA